MTGGTHYSEAKTGKPLLLFLASACTYASKTYLHCKTGDDSKASSSTPFSNPHLVTSYFVILIPYWKKKFTSPAT